MSSQYHKNIQKAVIGFGQSFPEKYVEVFTGEQKPIFIHHPSETHIEISYKPDAFFKTNKRAVYVFEILDKELGNISDIISDVTESTFTPDISKIFFIIPKDAENVKKIFEVAKVVIDTLDTVGFRKYPLFVAVYTISRKEANSVQNIKKVLKSLSKEDKW